MKQLQMIDKTKTLAQNDKNVAAVLMYGSFTKDEGDQYSDIEFYIFLEDKTLFSAENWVSQIHPLVLYFTNEYGSEVAIFENMVRGEFHFLTINELDVVKSWDGLIEFSDFNKMILVDKKELLTNVLKQIRIKTPDRATSENVSWLSQSLLNLLLTTGNLIKRGEFAHAYHNLSNVQKYLLWLIRIETAKTKHWESPTKSLEKDINYDWYSEFQQTTSELNPTIMKAAFRNAIALCERLFDELKVEMKLKEVLNWIRKDFN